MAQAGWALLAISLTPLTMYAIGQWIGAAVSSVFWWLVPGPLGPCLLLLALFPTDARAIRVLCATGVVLLTGFGALSISPQHSPKSCQTQLASCVPRCASPPPARSPPRCIAAASAPCSPAPPCGGYGP